MLHKFKYLAPLIGVLWAVDLTATQITMRNREGPPPPTDYNLKVGNLTLDLGYVFGIAVDDNTNNSGTEENREEGTRVANGLQIGVDWPLNPHFQISSALNVSWVSFISGEGTEGLIITGADGAASGNIAFDMRLGTSGLLTLEETINRNLDTIELDRVSNAEKFSLWNNTLALQYQNQLSQYLSTALKLSRKDTWAVEKAFKFRDFTSYGADLLLLWQVNSSVQVSPFVRYETINFLETDTQGVKRNDTDEFEYGANFTYQWTKATLLNISLSYQNIDVDTANNPLVKDEDEGPAGSIGLQTELTDVLSQTVSIGYRRGLGTSVGSTYSEDLTGTYGVNWQLAQKWAVAGQVNWLKGNESGVGGEISNTFTTTSGITYNISPTAKFSLAYRRTDKFSDLDSKDYERNIITSQFSYDF